MTSQLEFPAQVGPFIMAPADLPRAINTFYGQNSSFPKPDPNSNENSMVGMDPYAAGMGQGDIIFGQLSPLHRITLDVEAKAAANIPTNATTFAWAYPMVLESGQQRASGSTEAAFMELGGYVYFNDNRDVVGTNSIQPAPLGALGLMFGRAQKLPTSVSDEMTKQGRFQEITLQILADKGATHFGWIRPGEFERDVASQDGCFAYKFCDGALRYFPVVSKPIFTPELVQTTLDNSEAWVVIRNAADVPSIEKLVVFDKTKSMDENLFNASHGVQVSGSFTHIEVHRDSWIGPSSPSPLTYEAWAQLVEPGTIADPWIFHLVRTGQSPPSLTEPEIWPLGDICPF